MPRLLHPELVTVRPLDRAAQRVDALAGEPYAMLATAAEVQLRGQVEEDRRGERRPGQGGAELQEGGTVTFRLADVLGAAWEPTAGDEITSVADRSGVSRSVRWWITEAHRSGKRPRSKRADLVVVRFATRPPSRGQVGGL